ncbi:MAG: PEP-CTERM sorting domain-containing protein [Phycisphaeraceae bacterium]
MSDPFGTRAIILGAVAVAACMAMVQPAARGAVIVNETFADGDRTTDNPPGSLQWTYGAHHGSSAFTSLNAGDGALLWDHTTSGGTKSFSAIWGHFADAGTPLTLAVGDSLSLTFDVSFSNGTLVNSTNSFRWALLDSNNSRVTSDFAGNNATGIANGSTFGAWRGYGAGTAVFGSNTTGNNLVSRQRTGTGTGLYTSADWGDFSAVNEPLFALNTTYAGYLTLMRTATGVEVQAGINGASTLLVTDTVAPFVEFDTISFFVTDASNTDLTLDNIQLTYVPVPEPASVLSLLVLAGGLLGRRLRPRA